jgi:multiple sugar transport system substrate-binding protein
MSELELSLMSGPPNPLGIPPDALMSALEEFQARHGIRVQVRALSWDTAWAELVKVALYKTGSDISEVGSTWIDSFTTMDALRPFSLRETASLGGPSAFLPSSWKSGSMLGGQTTWAIPWVADARVIYYRRDLLKQAGIDERTAFETHEQLMHTLHRLQESGVATPWVMSTANERTVLHTVASWVWDAGGHFMSSDGRHTRFNEPEAQVGMYNCFSLHRYLSPDARNLNEAQANIMFRQGKAAATISGQWVLDAIRHQGATAEVTANLGVAFAPVVPFVGGSNLVIWKHSRHEREAMELARFLTSHQVQTSYVPQAGLLPARLDALATSPFTTDQPYQVISTSLKKGQGFQAAHMWGLIEDGLSATLSMLWTDIFNNPAGDLKQMIAERLEPLAQSFRRVLSDR